MCLREGGTLPSGISVPSSLKRGMLSGGIQGLVVDRKIVSVDNYLFFPTGWAGVTQVSSYSQATHCPIPTGSHNTGYEK